MSDQCWYVAYTKHRKEFQLRNGLMRKNIESYFPVDAEGLPLFSCYVFVCAHESQLHLVTYLPGFRNWVSFGKDPSVIPDEQISLMKKVSEYSKSLQNRSTKLLRGDEVRIVRGPLRGMVGKLVEDQGKRKLAMEINPLNQAILVSVPLEYVLPILNEKKAIA